MDNKLKYFTDTIAHQRTFSAPDQSGITYREYLIAQALNGYLASTTNHDIGPSIVAKRAIEYADKIIEELSKEANEYVKTFEQDE